MAAIKKGNKQKKSLDFDKSLILFKYFLTLFNSKDFNELKEHFKNDQLENFSEDGKSKFIEKIVLENIFGNNLSEEKLYEYDENIIRHTKRINERRDKKIKWKYFQYLTLLFTEIYLDMFFNRRERLLNELNNFLNLLLSENDLEEGEISKYTLEDLDKLAYWNATGSGKTLILHINILQYNYYVEKTGKNRVNKIILLTPNEGLSEQHLRELEQSSIPAEIFTETAYSQLERKVEIIDIHKIKKDKSSTGGKTFDISSFGKNNLLLVDEGHRGSSGKEWKSIRSTISEEGFVFEYSATFGQAIREEKELKEEYQKCILFDYSYKFFYNDNYGKDYKILNLEVDSDIDRRNMYLTASLLSFYQQIKLFKDDNNFNKNFNIEKPLMLFVGSSVNSVRTENKKDVSDVLDVLLFIKFFLENKKTCEEYINSILIGDTGFLNRGGEDIFINKYSFLKVHDYNTTFLYKDMVKEIFNSNITGATLHIENIKKADGEIGIKYGDNDYFALINIGDTDKFLKLCELHNLSYSTNDFNDSEFKKINKENSSINLLIGAKKFTEGWSSWRVSSIGLMNIGKNQGSQIIQLFGRGVRLKGYEFSLKRSIGLQNIKIVYPEFIEILETLNIFGIKANYMADFREYLIAEGLNPENQIEIIKLPVFSSLKFKNKIKVLRIRDGLSYKKNAENPILQPLNIENNCFEKFKKSIQERKIVLDLYTKTETIESRESREKKNIKLDKNTVNIEEETLEFLDFNRIYFEIQEYKKEKRFFNLNISKKNLKQILSNKNWYTLYCKQDEILLSIKNIRKIENISLSLLKKYIDRFYNFVKSDWEKDKLVYDYLENDPKSSKNLINEYIFEIENTQTEIINYINEVKSEIEKTKKNIEFSSLKLKEKISTGFEIIQLEEHLYNPLIFISKNNNTIKVKPVNLNEGEKTFIETLKIYYEKNKEYFDGKELYILRNQVGNLGFFEEGNFYPDFILWLIDGEKQYINFIDPKGIREEGLNSSKIGLYKTIKQYEKNLNSDDLILNSFILSVTPFEELEFKMNQNKEDFENKNVFFIDKNSNNSEKLNSIDKIFKKITI